MESKSKSSNGARIESQSLAAAVQIVSLKSSDGFVGGHVKLNVGGRFFYTTIDTLTKKDETMLSAMFSGRMEIPVDAEGWVLIDRSGKHFDTVLNHLRDGDAPLPKSESEIGELLAEAKYYCIASLVTVCEKYLSGLDIPKTPVLLLSSAKEWDRLLKASSIPIVRLVGKQTADVKILSNVELFNRLALRLHGRILFVYDTITSPDCLNWEFYYSGERFLTVTCGSPQQGYFFCEARVHEGIWMQLLYLMEIQ